MIVQNIPVDNLPVLLSSQLTVLKSTTFNINRCFIRGQKLNMQKTKLNWLIRNKKIGEIFN